MTSMAKSGRRFFLLFGIFVTGTCWYLAGAQTSLALFVGLLPLRFVKCIEPPCLENQVLTDPCDTTTPFRYIWPGLSIISTFNVSQCNPVSLALISLFAGIFAGAVLVVPISDSRGRRPIIISGLVGIISGTILSVITTQYWGYCLARFIVGICMSAITLPATALLSEITPIHSRHIGIILQAGGFCGAACTIAALALVIQEWKTLTIISVAPVYILLFTAMALGLCIESPKWLSTKGQNSKAYDTWTKIARICKSELAIDLETFIKYQTETINLPIINEQQILKPDSLAKALRIFPTSVWIYVSIYLGIVTSFVYYGVLLDFNQIITTDVKQQSKRLLSAASNQSQTDALQPFWDAKRQNVIVAFVSFLLEGPSYVFVMWLAAIPWVGRKKASTLMYGLGSFLLFLASLAHFFKLPMVS